MARRRDRAFAGFFAILFLVTASATSIAVILTLVQQHNQDKAAKTNSTTTTSKGNNVTKQLQGTQLAGFTPTSSIPTLQEIDTVPGTGATVKSGATITVDYTGAVASTGIIFQSSIDSGKAISFSLKGVIPGWTLGIPGMKVGGTRRLLIPANLAYGANPPPGSNIPANADLVFDVILHKID